MAGLEAKIKGFMRYPRKKHTLRDPNNGLVDMDEIFTSHNSAPVEGKIKEASRCMDCGVPFCQSDTGCPISNLILEFKALVYADKWEEAYRTLIKTNNLPEFTGRACPAPCEGACVVGINNSPVTITKTSSTASSIVPGRRVGWFPHLLKFAPASQ